MAARARDTPPGEWIRGFKYDDTKLAEGRPLNRLDLDEAVPDHPAVVGHRGGHTSVYNSRAFALAGVTAETPDPEGGKFYREDGELTGLVAERANYVISRLVPSAHTDDEPAGRRQTHHRADGQSRPHLLPRRGHLVEQPARLSGGLSRGRIVNSGGDYIQWLTDWRWPMSEGEAGAVWGCPRLVLGP